VASSDRIVRSYNGAPGYCLTRLAAFELLPGQQFLKNLLVSWATPYLSAHLNYCASTFENLLDSLAATGRSSVVPATALLGRLPRGTPALPQALLAFVARSPSSSSSARFTPSPRYPPQPKAAPRR
jgi:hypothetical protein